LPQKSRKIKLSFQELLIFKNANQFSCFAFVEAVFFEFICDEASKVKLPKRDKLLFCCRRISDKIFEDRRASRFFSRGTRPGGGGDRGQDLRDDQPQRGSLLLCSSPVGEISMGAPKAERTLFTGAVLEVLRHGVEGGPAALSFADLRDAAYQRMLVNFGANAPRPVLHQVNAAHGDLTRTPAFPNRAARRQEEEAERVTAKERRR
jgi:hypothetical protein